MRVPVTSLGLLVLLAAGALAENTDTQEFSIAAQPVPQALREYAQQSGDQVVFYSDVGKGLESTAVEGRFTRQEALQKLLLNTGLQSERVNAKTVAITAPNVPPAALLQPRQSNEHRAPDAAIAEAS